MLPDGRQVLMAAFYTGTFGLFFDAKGSFLEYRTIGPESLGENPNGYGPDPKHLEEWKGELQFRPKTIHVERFYVNQQGVGVDDLPSHYEDFLDDPDSETDPEERGHMAQDIRRWMEDGSFVLYWGNDLWLDGRGHVTSS